MKKRTKKRFEDEEPEGNIEESAQSMFFLNAPTDGQEEGKLRLLSLYGEVEEEKAADLTYALYFLRDSGKLEKPKDPEDPDSEIEISYEPIELMISTYGGSAAEMFSIYDVMRYVRRDCEILTMGLGKVMSAGVLLLAAGTKGKRRIGKNCKIMIHSVIGGSAGAIHNLENEMEELRLTQQQYIDALIEETSMSKRYIKKLLGKKINIYLSAEEAVKLGIADEIV